MKQTKTKLKLKDHERYCLQLFLFLLFYVSNSVLFYFVGGTRREKDTKLNKNSLLSEQGRYGLHLFLFLLFYISNSASLALFSVVTSGTVEVNAPGSTGCFGLPYITVGIENRVEWSRVE